MKTKFRSDKIAAEARRKIARLLPKVMLTTVGKNNIDAIIKSAIEEALSGQRIYGEWGTAVIIPDEAAQPQRSEHTDECIGRLCSHVLEPFTHDAKTN